MIDASHVKVHPHAAGAVGGNQDMGKTKGGLIQRYILHLKRWRGIATKYAKRTDSFIASVQIRCLVLWLNIS